MCSSSADFSSYFCNYICVEEDEYFCIFIHSTAFHTITDVCDHLWSFCYCSFIFFVEMYVCKIFCESIAEWSFVILRWSLLCDLYAFLMGIVFFLYRVLSARLATKNVVQLRGKWQIQDERSWMSFIIQWQIDRNSIQCKILTSHLFSFHPPRTLTRWVWLIFQPRVRNFISCCFSFSICTVVGNGTAELLWARWSTVRIARYQGNFSFSASCSQQTGHTYVEISQSLSTRCTNVSKIFNKSKISQVG